MRLLSRAHGGADETGTGGERAAQQVSSCAGSARVQARPQHAKTRGVEGTGEGAQKPTDRGWAQGGSRWEFGEKEAGRVPQVCGGQKVCQVLPAAGGWWSGTIRVGRPLGGQGPAAGPRRHKGQQASQLPCTHGVLPTSRAGPPAWSAAAWGGIGVRTGTSLAMGTKVGQAENKIADGKEKGPRAVPEGGRRA